MKNCFAYIRVSTAKQGEQGVSLQEQRDAIARYADRNSLKIIQWYEERETAAKRGRPIFNQMLKRLKKGDADCIIIHKIDRSARNLRDWADLGELIDQGIDVFFVNESLDLHSRGGRLSADIQAVVAADYIRNLREETRKGFYGRLKQGLYPMPAPLGYLDQGQGKPKAPDPVRAPLVRKAFELYATGRYNLTSLAETLFELGLRNRKGNKLIRTGLSEMLNNPFYIGLIRLKRTGESFSGNHPPIIKTTLFHRVQAILRGRTVEVEKRHNFIFRRLLKCRLCRYSLVAERQKGHVYYRCQTTSCPVKCFREEQVDEQIAAQIIPLQFNPAEKAYVRRKLSTMKVDWVKRHEENVRSLTLNLTALENRLNRLTDAYLDQAIDRTLFEQKKTTLILEKKGLEEKLAELKNGGSTGMPAAIEEFLELAGNAYVRWKLAKEEEKRDLLQDIASNCDVDEKSVMLTLKLPFSEIAGRPVCMDGGPYRYRPRTLDALILRLSKILSTQPSLTIRSKNRQASAATFTIAA